MHDFSKTLKEIYGKQKALSTVIVLILVAAIALLIYSILNLEVTSSTVIVWYGDVIGGYQSGAWWNMIAFPLLAIIYGVLHNLLIVKLYQKKGSGVAMMFAVMTLMLILATFIVLARLLREG